MVDIKHRNTVTLHGYYTAPHYNLLIYELMPNGSLDTFLHVKAVVEDKREEYVLDGSLEGCPINEINNVLGIALMCLESEPSKRPTMAEDDYTFISENHKLVRTQAALMQL
ncbi:hypothetical protein JRO89_XS15G0068600 [Xanthoceras sorbifolium]|uniref:Serine-threonine/tyrosine-protein kinase catalytic domain-containing protein n=1 Tax=Xanthoceras sorbifolium TaxID=99658 RepID=A0ABQ8H156_9ROSI|nr:hypothetical protein JRO89_XS15G0068600 [Xanthoceras sorbifolium]